MDDIAMGFIVGLLRGIPQMMQDIQNNSKMNAEEKKKNLDLLATEIRDLNQQVAAYKFKDV